MPWIRKRRVTKAAADARKTPAEGPARVALGDGTFLTISAGMGKLFDVPARPAALDLGADAGWERWQAFRRRLGGS
jgi:hypothetical protein